MNLNDINLPIAEVGTLIIVVAGGVWGYARAMSKFTEAIGKLKGTDELLAQRVVALENAENTAIELRLTAVEKRQEELLNLANITKWEKFFDRTEQRLKALEKQR